MEMSYLGEIKSVAYTENVKSSHLYL